MLKNENTADIDLNELAAILYSAVVSDSCDRQGYRHQTTTPVLRPMSASGKTIVGWARTVTSVAVDAEPERPYATEINFVDSLRQGDVVVANTDGEKSGFWGELFSTAAVGRGARGAVIDGYVRDRAKMDTLGFPVHARGARPADSLGRLSVAQQDQPINFLGVEVNPGDLVVADLDGVTIVPGSVIEPVLAYAIEKVSVEDSGRALLRAGGKLGDVWTKYRVL